MDKKGVIVIGLLIIFLIPLVAADSVDSEIKKITHYAEEYETGNINYPQLLVYTSSVREVLNKELGVVSRDFGGLIREEQIRGVLGEPSKTTRWVWMEKEHREIRMDDAVPVWEKIVFDGKKIQIRFEVFPSIFKKGLYDEDFEGMDEKEKELRKKKFEEKLDFNSEGVALIYRLNFNVEFKRPQEQLDISGKISSITSLGEVFNNDPLSSNAETLAKESVNAERLFENYIRQGGGDCNDVMNRVFGSENKRETQKLNVQEVYFHYGDNFESIIRVEMCGSCEWNYINLDTRIDGRGPGFKFPKIDGANNDDLRQKYLSLSWDEFESKTRELINSAKSAFESNDIESAFKYSNELREIIQAWNEKSNNVWEEVEKMFPNDFNNDVQRDVYYWIEREIEKRNKVEQLKKSNYEKKKRFFEDLFSGYEKDEFYFEQIRWEKRLIEEFTIEGREVCDNGIDDNDDNSVDCGDDSCGGQVCGWNDIEIKDESIKAGEKNEKTDSTISENVVVDGESGTGTNVVEIEVTKGSDTMNNVVENVVVDGDSGTGTNVVESESSGGGLSLTGNVVSEGESKVGNSDNETTSVTKTTQNTETETSEGIETSEISSDSDSEEEDVNKYTPKTKKVPMYCIEKKCQLREEDKGGKGGAKCGNHVCENGENIANCNEDCGTCNNKIMIECPFGSKAIFKGKDKNGCPLDPICVRETNSCNEDSDCSDPLCGKASCEDGLCKVKEIKECKEQECVDGDKKMGECPDGAHIVNAICTSGMWNYLDIFCEGGGKGEEKAEVVGVVDDKCVTKSDCGGENDVCSNGKCVTIINRVEGGGGEVIDIGVREVDNVISPVEEEHGEVIEPVETPVENVPIPASEPEPALAETPAEPAFVSEPEPALAEIPAEPITGNIIFNFISSLIFSPVITGNFITGSQVDEGGGEIIQEPAPVETTQEPTPVETTQEPIKPSEPINPSGESPDSGLQPSDCGPDGCQESPKDYNDNSNYQENNNDWKQSEEEDRRAREERDTKEREERCNNECKRVCDERLVAPCVEKCVFGENHNNEKIGELEGCKSQCENQVDTSSCISDCLPKCTEDKWDEINKDNQREPNKMEKGVFMVNGNCRTEQGKTNGNLWFGGWGEPFQELEKYKRKYYEREGDWCKWDIENLINQRKELENGFNQDFIKWFFESYLANKAEDWEQHVSGIYELYWRNVEVMMQLSQRMQCLDKNDITEIYQPKLNNFSYKSDYGRVEYWEELKFVKMPEMDNKKVRVVSPYMKIWVYPPKSFIKYEMKKSMKEHEFPGSDEDKLERENEEGLTSEEKAEIKKDNGLMKTIKKISDNYNGNVNLVLQVKDFDNDEVVYNLHVQINEDDIFEMEPMLPSEVPQEDIRVEIDFEKVYDFIHYSEKNMRGEEIQSPPWDEKRRGSGNFIKGAVDGVTMFFKINGIINSAQVYPKSAKGDFKKISSAFIKIMMKKDTNNQGKPGEDKKGEDLIGESGKKGDEGIKGSEEFDKLYKDNKDPKAGISGKAVFG